MAREYPEKSSRELACYITDKMDYFISESSVYRILKVVHRPRLLSDNGSAYVSKELRRYLEANEIYHIRTKPYHPMTQGKIESYHRSMKNLILLDHYYTPSELEERIREWVDYYNNHRYHEAIDNVTPRDKYFGRDKEILKNRMKIKKQTIRERRKINKMIMRESLPNGIN